MSTQNRKAEQLRICLEQDVEVGDPGFSDVKFIHNPLPDVDFRKIDLSTTFLGKKLSAPIMITAITGGIPEAREINRGLAQAAEEKGIAFGLGSQRAMIENPELRETYYVRDVAPNILLLGNIGIAQLKKIGQDKISQAAKDVGADGICVHLNPEQEVLQPEGDSDFTGCLGALKELCSKIKVVAKGVGSGISKEAAQKLKSAGVAAIDVGGFGGANWKLIDAIYAKKEIGELREWGIPTAVSILECKNTVPLIASGGVRSGFDIAKSLALGAEIAGAALPFLRAFKKGGKEAVVAYIEKLENELRTAMFLTGCKNLAELKKTKYILSSAVQDWIKQR